MNELTKTGIFLRRSAHHRKRPNGILPGKYFVDLHQWKRMLQAVITQVITKWPLGFIFTRPYFSSNDKIGLRADTITIYIGITETPVAQHTGKSHFTDTFRQRHYSTYAVCWGAA